jgi:8-oxo-dGTP diphosphatase
MEQEINFCPRCGSAVTLIERFGNQRPVCSQCGWTYFADPKVAVAVLLEQDDRVLLVRRVNEPFRGLWSLPAGFVDAGEDPARAAERECLEETGLIVRVTQVMDIIAGREHPRGADFIIVYHGLVVRGELHAADDADQAEWLDRKSVV